MTQATLALDVFGDENRKGDISRIENGKAGTPQEATLQKLKAKLDIPQDAIDALRSEAVVNDAYVDALRARVFNLADSLHLTQELVTQVARRNAIASHDNFDAALAGIEEALRVTAADRAKPLSNYGEAIDQMIAQVNALNDTGDLAGGTKALDAILAAQKNKSAEAEQGVTSLLRKRVAQAVLERSVPDAVTFTLERLAREMPDRGERFAALRAEFMVWYERGRDKGLNFDLEVAIGLAKIQLSIARGPDERGNAGLEVAIALSTLGEREIGTRRLNEAVQAFETVLQDWKRDKNPYDWALVKMNMGNTLKILGERQGGTTFLEAAVDAIQSALEVWTRETRPRDWAYAQLNLGATFQVLGEHENGTSMLSAAVRANQAALTLWTQEHDPQLWAKAQNNLGNALCAIGERESGTTHLREAVRAFELALTVRTRERFGLDWGITQNNLGKALSLLGQQENGHANMMAAIHAFESALLERTRNRVPLEYAMTHCNLANAHFLLSQTDLLAKQKQHLLTSLSHVDNALEVYTPLQTPLQLAQAERLRDQVMAALAARE